MPVDKKYLTPQQIPLWSYDPPASFAIPDKFHSNIVTGRTFPTDPLLRDMLSPFKVKPRPFVERGVVN